MKNSVVIIFAILILVISFFVFTNTPFFVKGYAKIRNSISEIAGPALTLISRPAYAVKGYVATYVDLINIKKENVLLKKKLEALQLENQRIPELEKENKRLKSILKFSEQNPESVIVARVIGEDLKNWFKSVIVDKGKDHGIREKMPAITPTGIVGQAVEVNKWHSKVMIINDTNSSVDVYVEGKSTRGILEGTGQTVLKLKYVLKNDEIEIGDKLVTSGKDGIYPKGLPVGIVITVNRGRPGIFADIEAMPFNNFKQLEEVIFIKR